MMKSHAGTAYLKQVTSPISGISLLNQSISAATPTVVGRDQSCQIVLGTQYQSVSKRHLELRAVSNSDRLSWELRDLGSSNGTYVNNQRVHHVQTLKHGDRIRLGKNGPEFVFECLPIVPMRPGGAIIPYIRRSLTSSEVLPILTSGMVKKSYLIPGGITVVFAVLLFMTQSSEQVCSAIWINPLGFPVSCYNILLGQYLALAGLYFVYLQCGKQKPWWVLAGAGLTTILLLSTYLSAPIFLLFRYILPGDVATLLEQLKQGQAVNPFAGLITMFFGAGLAEELLKAVPIFIALYIGRQVRSPRREQIGVWEPLDGILLGAASAVGFTLLETLGQYVPDQIAQYGASSGLELLIPRIVSSVAGHIAYSGYFGYFIGLAVLKPHKRWKLLGIGYLTASVVHALWNSVSLFAVTTESEVFLRSLVGIVAYVFLMSAIVRARHISPNRSQNFATQVYSDRLP